MGHVYPMRIENSNESKFDYLIKNEICMFYKYWIIIQINESIIIQILSYFFIYFAITVANSNLKYPIET